VGADASRDAATVVDSSSTTDAYATNDAAALDAATDAKTADAQADATMHDAQADAMTPDAQADAAPVDAAPVYPDATAGCMTALYTTYVLRWDDILIWENAPTNPQTIVETSTGTPLTGIVDVQEGQYHGCAALAGGTVECWQTNASNGNVDGQLGNGTTTAQTPLYRATPVLTDVNTPLSNVVHIARGEFYSSTSCAVTSDGKVWCWGDLSWLVNKGTATLHTGYAQAITTDGMNALTNVVQVALGPATACAVVAGTPNSVWCWGYNAHAELGLGDTTTRQYPTKVLGLTNPTQVSISGDSNVSEAAVCALDGDNVRCWGLNSYGAAGINATTNPVLNPTAVVTQAGVLLGGVTDIEPGGSAFAALRTDGTIWTWGYGSQNYASNYGLTNIVAVGWAGPSNYNGPRYLTKDGVYHNAMTAVTVNCNAM
jgi:hypothetical protein